MNYANETLNEREKTHGDYGDTAHIAQGLKEVLRRCPEFDALDSPMRESLEMICTKMARILSGNPNHVDAWTDIGGYSDLIRERLEKPAVPVAIKVTERTVIVPGIRVVNEVIEEEHEG